MILYAEYILIGDTGNKGYIVHGHFPMLSKNQYQPADPMDPTIAHVRWDIVCFTKTTTTLPPIPQILLQYDFATLSIEKKWDWCPFSSKIGELETIAEMTVYDLQGQVTDLYWALPGKVSFKIQSPF